MSENKNKAMNMNYFIRWFKDGRWQNVNVQDLTEEEFRQYLMYQLNFIGVKKNAN